MHMLGEVATPQRALRTSSTATRHFNIVLILPPVITVGAIRKKPVIPLMLSARVLCLVPRRHRAQD